MAAETGRPQGLNQQRAKTEQELAALRKDYGQLKQTVNDELTEEREQVYRHLEVLQKDNEFLSGKCLEMENSEMLRARRSTFHRVSTSCMSCIDGLHVLVLTLHENLIVTKAGDEFVERKTLSMQDEVALLRDQQHNREQEVRRTERDYHDKIVQQVLEEQLRQQYQHSQQLVAYKEELERAEADNKRQISELRMQAIELGYQRKARQSQHGPQEQDECAAGRPGQQRGRPEGLCKAISIAADSAGEDPLGGHAGPLAGRSVPKLPEGFHDDPTEAAPSSLWHYLL
ncbi:hypothetical protein RP20_CCG019704 [Aedes albopictus]|nr:hypothetical protein RP20_CCG019704 [Aedes albopictus]